MQTGAGLSWEHETAMGSGGLNERSYAIFQHQQKLVDCGEFLGAAVCHGCDAGAGLPFSSRVVV
jgi:hypothetical protein